MAAAKTSLSQQQEIDLAETHRLPSRGHALERAALERVLAHAEISRSTSLIRFLSFICNKYFDGQTDEIREYSIAVDALGRKESSFDSRVDPIVRVTARALRKKLCEYYANEGKDDPVQIVLPRGHYVPQFVLKAEAEPWVEQDEEVSEPIEIATEAVRTPLPQRLHNLPWKKIAQIGGGVVALAAVFVGGYLAGRRAEAPNVLSSGAFKWGEPVWSDEFDGRSGQLPDATRWAYDSGNNTGWGNNEIEIYCAPNSANHACNPHRPNAFVDGEGHLVLRAERGSDGTWTSARITTRGLKDFQYGRIEARIKMPVGNGLWPSFWMLGSDFPAVGWPAAGSVDIMENVSLTARTNGLGPSMIRTTLHGPRFYGPNGLWHDYRLPNGARVDDGSFHTYGIIWSPGMIQFYVDDPANVFYVESAASVPEGGSWVFDHPFYLVMNLALGGDWAGKPDATTPNPADMLVDYIRAYKTPTVPAPSIQWQPVTVKSGAAVASGISLTAHANTGRVFLSCSTEPATVNCALATPIVNFSDTLNQQDSLTLSTDSYTGSGRMVAPPGHYKLTITATTISGDRSQLTMPFDVAAE